MIKITICDDDKEMCRLLSDTISQKLDSFHESYRITCHTHAAGLLAAPPDSDLLFLDIRMPGTGGISLAKQLRKQNFSGAIIFVTVLKDHMLDAFEVEAFDYLCKPIDEIRLENALKRFLKRRDSQKEANLLIRTANRCRTIRLCDIYYCEVINRKIYLHTADGTVDYYGKLKEVERQLDDRFIKCHRSYIINLAFLQEYAGGQILLKNGNQIPVSRSHHQTLLNAMLQYMERRD